MERLDRITTRIVRFLVGTLVVAICLWGILWWREPGANAPPAATAIPTATAIPYPTRLPCDEITDSLDRSDCYDYQAQKDWEWEQDHPEPWVDPGAKYEGGDGSECFPDPRGGGC